MGRFLAALLLVAAASAASAAEPDSRSAAIVRLLNSRQSGTEKSFARAAEIVREDADAGMPLQRFVIAIVSDWPNPPPAARMSDGLRREYKEGTREKIRALAEKHGNALAWYLLSLDANDMQMLERAADLGNVQALNAWGTITLDSALTHPGIAGTNAIHSLMRKCFGCFRRAAAKKDANGIYNLGLCYLNGYGCKRDVGLALASMQTAAEAGHPEAINNIGGLYRDGVVVPRDLGLALRWFRKSMELDNDYGTLNYALALKRGEGIERDEAAAFKLIEGTAKRGHAESQNVYGACLLEGSGCEKNPSEGVAWLRKAASQGFAPAMDNLASCYDHGEGVEADAALATEWTVRARAARGDRSAAMWLKKNAKVKE